MTLLDDWQDDRPPIGPSRRFRRTLAGGVLAGALTGLAEALEDRPLKEQPPVVQEAGEPVDDLPVVVHLVADDPRSSWAELRA